MQKFFFEKLCLLITVGTADYSLDRGAWPVGLSERFGSEFVLYVPVANWTRFVTLNFLEIVIFPEVFETLSVRDFVLQGKFIDLAIVLLLIFNYCLCMIVPA